MSQHDYNIANADGATVRADINSVLDAIASNNAGSTAPSTTFPNQWWFDTSNALLKQRDNANTAWVTVAAKDASGWRPYYNGTQLDGVFLQLINSLTAETAPATADLLALYDASAAGYRKMTFENFLKVINLLTADASPDAAADYVLTYDTSASAVKRALIQDIQAGALEFISSQDASASATLDFTGFDSSKYDAYLFVLANVTPATDNVDLLLRLSNDAGATYRAGASDYAYDSFGTTPTGSADGLYLTTSDNLGNAAGEEGWSGVVKILGPHLAKKTTVDWSGGGFTPTGALAQSIGAGAVNTAEANNAARFIMSSGNIANGTISQFGLRNA